jgi:dihydroorotase
MLDRLKVQAYDANNSCFCPAIVRGNEGKYFLDKDDSVSQASDLYLSPGWIDLHTHINDGFGLFGGL